MYEHTGLNLLQINELEYDEYLALARDAFIYKLNQSQSGQEYLEKCWMIEQKKPDRKALREKFKKKEV